MTAEDIIKVITHIRNSIQWLFLSWYLIYSNLPYFIWLDIISRLN